MKDRNENEQQQKAGNNHKQQITNIQTAATEKGRMSFLKKEIHIM